MEVVFEKMPDSFTLPSHPKSKTELHLSWLGKLLLLYCLRKFDRKQIRLGTMQRNEFGKPFLPGHRFDFSISHSGDIAICAFSETHKVGIDIEKMDLLELKDFEHVFEPDEWSQITESRDPLLDFYRRWTMKEAVCKGDGRGLNISLVDLKILRSSILLEGTRWNLRPVDIECDYVAHLASNAPFSENVMIEGISMSELLVQTAEVIHTFSERSNGAKV